MPNDGLTEKARKDLAEVGKRIRAIREGRGMTLKDLADELPADNSEKKNPKVLSRYELGARQMRVTTFFSFAEVFKVTPNDISPARLLSHLETPGQIFSELNQDDQDTLLKFARIMREKHGRGTRGGKPHDGNATQAGSTD